MDMQSNFDRAQRLMQDWPEWKRNYQLVKGPLPQDEVSASRERHSRPDEDTQTKRSLDAQPAAKA